VRVKARDVPGGATLTFVATAGNASAKIEETLSVRPPLPSMTALLSGYAEKGEKRVKQGRDLYKEICRRQRIGIHPAHKPYPGACQYLDRFPYGCTEQTISKAFPTVVLYGQQDLGGDAGIVEKSVVHTMSRCVNCKTEKADLAPGGMAARQMTSSASMRSIT